MTKKTLKYPPAIEFGVGSLNNLSGYITDTKSDILLITGAHSLEKSGFKRIIQSQLLAVCTALHCETMDGEPSPEVIDSLVKKYNSASIGCVVAIGGGSALDGGKALAAMLPVNESIVTYLEGVGTRKPSGEKIPFIAVPTTSGTGSEATSNAVITKTGPSGFKKSLRHDRYIPDVALIDPLLIRSCSPEITASCGMDAFTQLVEAYLSTQSSPHTDLVAMRGIESLRMGLLASYENGDDITARSQVAFGSLCSGVALMNAGLGVVHGLAPLLGAQFSIPHGIVCGTLMAPANEITLKKLQESESSPETLGKYARLGRMFSHTPGKSDDYYCHRFIEHLHELSAQLKLPRLSHYGVIPDDLKPMCTASVIKNNPIDLSENEIEQILLSRL